LQYYHSYLNAKHGKNDRDASCAFCLNRIVRACAQHASALHYPHTLIYHDCETTLYTDEAPESAALRTSEALDSFCAENSTLDAFLEALPDGETARFYLKDADGNTLSEVTYPLFRGKPDCVVGEEADAEALERFIEDVFRTVDGLR
jgi:hypothetical protein